VSRGGPYYMISRALGPVLGASVGIMYWLAITMLAVLECIGAVEALTMAVPGLDFPAHKQTLGSCLMAFLALTVWGGINVVTKLGVFFAFVVVLTLFSYYFGLCIAPATAASKANPWITGLSFETLQQNWIPHYDASTTFGVVLSLFYPCYTGILSGANRADVLRDPPSNLRHGTFAAVIVSFFMYSSLFVLWGSVADFRYLQGLEPPMEPGHARRLGGGGGAAEQIVDEIVWNPFPKAAFIGIIIACLSQSLQCLIVAPRLLQSIAKDEILAVLTPLAPMSRSGEPARALLGSYLVGAMLVLIGELDVVAPLLTMCFLVTYAFMNFSCCALTWLKSPAWRPPGIDRRRCRVWNLFTSFAGFVLCVSIMVIVNKWWALAALALSGCLYMYINLKLEAREWGSAMDGIKYRFALSALMDLEASQNQRVNWRPQVLILYRVNVAEELRGIKHREILQFYAQLRKSRGFCVVACVLEAQTRSEHVMHIAEIEKGVIKTIMKDEGITGFAEVVVAPNWAEGSNYVIQLTGIGGIVPNTVLLDWPASWRTNPQEAVDFVSVISTTLAVEKAVLAVKGLCEMPADVVHDGTIDIWWMIHDGGFLLLLAWLLHKHRTWRSCTLRVFTIAENVSAESAKVAAEMLTRTLHQRRLFDVDVEVILADDEMIEPYTYDWTLRVEERQQFLSQLPPGRRPPQDALPAAIDDLFRRAPPLGSQPEPRATVSDCRLAGSGPQQSGGPADLGNDKVPEVAETSERPGSRPSTVFERQEDTCANVSPTLGVHLCGKHSPAESDVGESSDGRGSRPSMVLKSQEDVYANLSPPLDAQPSSSQSSELGGPNDAVPKEPTCRRRPHVLPHHLEGTSVVEVGLESSRRPAPMPSFHEDWGTKMNQIMYARSKRAEIVVVNLPDLWGSEREDVLKFMAYCDALTRGLERVLFVHSSGHEVFDLK